RSRSGFDRPPRLLRIEPNVVPVQQSQTISRELNVANGMPDLSFILRVPGLRFATGKEPLKVEVAEPTGLKEWKRCDRLSEHGPDDDVYELDYKNAEVTFGNGINGRIPPAECQVFFTYSVYGSVAGNVGRNRKWNIAGFQGVFGINPDPISGGADTSSWIDLRRVARQRSKEEHALISSRDIVNAALAIQLLEVARAWVVEPDVKAPRNGIVRLIALRSRPDG